jgi:hypothetical protein
MTGMIEEIGRYFATSGAILQFWTSETKKYNIK